MRCKVLMTETAIADLKKIALDILDVSKDAETALKFVAELRAEVALPISRRQGRFPMTEILSAKGTVFSYIKSI